MDKTRNERKRKSRAKQCVNPDITVFRIENIPVTVVTRFKQLAKDQGLSHRELLEKLVTRTTANTCNNVTGVTLSRDAKKQLEGIDKLSEQKAAIHLLKVFDGDQDLAKVWYKKHLKILYPEWDIVLQKLKSNCPAAASRYQGVSSGFTRKVKTNI